MYELLLWRRALVEDIAAHLPNKYRVEIAGLREKSLALLEQAVKGLQEELAGVNDAFDSATKPAQPIAPARKVFVVHGHDEGAREAVARFLERLGFEAIVLHERANQGRTVIEKVEVHGDVGFAVVLLTPDDEGAKRGEALQPRARQNVLLELGYFIGRLGREQVCALKRGQVEFPSDFGGVAYASFDDGGGCVRPSPTNFKLPSSRSTGESGGLCEVAGAQVRAPRKATSHKPD